MIKPINLTDHGKSNPEFRAWFHGTIHDILYRLTGEARLYYVDRNNEIVDVIYHERRLTGISLHQSQSNK